MGSETNVTTAKTNILYISHSGGWQGGEKALAQLIDGLPKDFFSATVILPEKGPLEAFLVNQHIETHIIPLQKWIDFPHTSTVYDPQQLQRNVEEIRHIIADKAIDIVHTNTTIVVEGAIAAYRSGVRHVWHLHEFIAGHPSLRPKLPVYLTYRLIDVLSDAVVAVSANLSASAAIGISSNKLVTIPNGISPLTVVNKKEARESLNIPVDAVVVTTIGHLIKEKGYYDLCKAAVEVLNANEKVVFIAVGDKSHSEVSSSVLRKIEESGLELRFILLGTRDDIPRILSATDIYVCSSLTESFSLAIIEAMSLGIPVVATRCGGPNEIVIDGATGFLIPTEDPESLKTAILDLAKSEKKRDSFGKNGQERFNKLYTKEKYCQSFVNLYSGLSKTDTSSDDANLANALIDLLTNVDQPKDEALHAVLNSLSWKVTAPLRSAYDLLLRARRRPR